MCFIQVASVSLHRLLKGNFGRVQTQLDLLGKRAGTQGGVQRPNQRVFGLWHLIPKRSGGMDLPLAKGAYRGTGRGSQRAAYQGQGRSTLL